MGSAAEVAAMGGPEVWADLRTRGTGASHMRDARPVVVTVRNVGARGHPMSAASRSMTCRSSNPRLVRARHLSTDHHLSVSGSRSPAHYARGIRGGTTLQGLRADVAH